MSACDVSFVEITERYPNEASAVYYFEERRWPDGARCTACDSADVVRGRTTRAPPPALALPRVPRAVLGHVGDHHGLDHHAVNHSKRIYATTAPDGHLATTNTAEGLFANLKRQIQGTHHHTSAWRRRLARRRPASPAETSLRPRLSTCERSASRKKSTGGKYEMEVCGPIQSEG